MTMATPTHTHTTKPARPNNNRSRKQRGRGSGKKESASAREASTTNKADATSTQDSSSPAEQITESVSTLTVQETNNENLCWICTEPVKYFSLSECNHRTCHVCALRLRALYKRMDCTFCKHPQPTLIYTRSPDQLYETFTPEQIPFKDIKLSIFFESQDMMEETLLLLRFNCPDSDCDFVGHGWGDLKMHVRSTHNCLLCDLCTRFKKVFSHEHIMYPPSQLPIHLPSIPRRNTNKSVSSQVQIEGGIHPLCEFCRECCFGDDEMFTHMREKHEECFICKRNGIRDQYFQDYGSLDHHFNNAHYPCKDSNCQAQKFVVFGSVLDLKAHMVEQHGEDLSAKDKKDLRRLDSAFEYESREDSTSRQAKFKKQDRDRERELPESSQSARRREAFGASLTSESHNPPSTQPSPKPFSLDQSQLSEVSGINSERYTAFIARVIDLTTNLSNAVPAIEAAIRSYISNESGPRDLINTVFNVVDRNIDDTASLMSALVELLDDEEKRRALLTSWNGFKIEQRQQFPDLIGPALGSGYAGVASGRIINIKHSMTSRSSAQSSGQVWERVAQAAKSTSTAQGPPVRPKQALKPPSSNPAFPALLAAKNASVRQGSTSTTPWSSGGATRPRSEVVPTPSLSASKSTSPHLSSELFPTLPISAKTPRVPMSGNQSLKNILGDGNVSSSSAWGPKRDENGQAEFPTTPLSADSGTLNPNKGKKKKGKEKQTLFVIGTFPT